MSQSDPIKFAVISDIHAYSKNSLAKDEEAPSFMELSAPDDLPGENPFAALFELVERETLRADVLICCGDLGDKASPDAVRYVWGKLKELAKLLECDSIIVTTGNHDMDSRFVHNDHDARSILQGLSDYPFPNEILNNEYWARNVVVQNDERFRYAVLNSSAYHGYNDDHVHGRISPRTLQYLKNELEKGASAKGVNVLVVHHHPQKVTSTDLGDHSEMVDGAALLEVLDSGEYGRWLIVHGHRHLPNISYGPGSSESSVVFSAGSFSAVPYADIASRTRNQFYILAVEPMTVGRVRGTFRAWDWISDEGFGPAQSRSGLPHKGGFGASVGASAIAQGIAELVGTSGFVTWESLLDTIPDARFLAPKDLTTCKSLLKKEYGVEMVFSDEGVPLQVGRQP